jgi:Domain of unknown function DUF29
MNGSETNQKQISSLYDKDFYAWTQEQASLLHSRQWSQLDLLNLIEEIESLGRQERRELINRLSVLVGHLLKWQYQSQQRTRSWVATIAIQRLDITKLIEESPSLKPDLEAALQQAYLKAINLAVQETSLLKRTFPAECPYSFIEILSDRFYPGEPSDLLNEE